MRRPARLVRGYSHVNDERHRLARRTCGKLTWPYGYGYIQHVKSIAAGKFKDVCLKTLDEVANTKTPIVITKRGHPVATLVPFVKPTASRSLAGSVLEEVGDPFSTGERWDADSS